MKRFGLLLLAIVLLSGCSATGPIFKEDVSALNDKAIIYVYRPSAFFNAGGYPNLYVDGKDYGPLYNGGYIPLVVPPGSISLVLKGDFATWGMQKPIGMKLNAAAGKKHFVRFGNEITSFFAVPGAGFYTSQIAIQETPEEFGRAEISSTNLSSNNVNR